MILLDDESDIEIEEQINGKEFQSIVNNLIGKFEINTEILVAKPNLPIRTCTTAVAYYNPQDIHVIMVRTPLIFSVIFLLLLQIHNPQLLTSECITKRQIYMNQPCPSLNIPLRTRVLDHSRSLLGFIYEIPCLQTNNNRYLVLYDNYTASYHSHSQLHLCLCQDFRRHLSNLDCRDLRTHYQHAFQHSHQSIQDKYTLNSIIRVRKFGSQYHNVRVIDIDYSVIKICFFQRKSQTEMWIHSNASIIEQTPPSPPATPQTDEPLDASRLRKRKPNEPIHTTKKSKRSFHLFILPFKHLATKKLREQSTIKSPIDDHNFASAARANILTTYYTNILLPKFRIRNALPSEVHKCSPHCVLSAEEHFSPKHISTNPFLLPFECHWSIVDSKPHGYRTPCRRALYSLDDIEQYLFRTQSKLSIKFFIDGVLTRFKPPIDDYDQDLIIMNDLSHGLENVTISVFNDIDQDKPDNFTYITHIRPIDQRIAAAFNDTNSTSCCDCTDK